jgi:hypothetical protein
MDEDDYKKQLWEFFASKGGVNKEFGMFSAQNWYVRNEAVSQAVSNLKTQGNAADP